MPFVKASLFLQLQTAAQAAADTNLIKLVANTDDSSEAKLPTAEPKLPAGPSNGKAPYGWADISVGNLVLAMEAPGGGWWESVVLAAEGDCSRCDGATGRTLPRFVRRRWQLALLHPAGRG